MDMQVEVPLLVTRVAGFATTWLTSFLLLETWMIVEKTWFLVILKLYNIFSQTMECSNQQ